MATKRVQTPRQQPNQVRLQPQASVVDTFVRPARNDQISKALDSVTGNVKRVEVKEERRLDMIQASKKQSAQNTFNIGYKALIDQEQFARMSPEQITETPEYQKLFQTSLDMVDDEDLKGILNTSMSSTAFATNNVTSQKWARKDLHNAGAGFARDTLDMFVTETSDGYRFDGDKVVFEPDGLTKELRDSEVIDLLPSRIKQIESVLKEKYGYSNTDLQNYWLQEQERRGVQFEDTLIGDYLLAAGNGGPDYRNKVIALNEKAKNAKLRSDTIKNVDALMSYQSSASTGQFSIEQDLAARLDMEEGILSVDAYLSIHRTNNTAIANLAAQDRKATALQQSVALNLSGQSTLNSGTYLDHNNKEVTISKQDIDRATQEYINNTTQAGGGTPEEILGRQVDAYSRANVLNDQWVVQFSKAFDSLGTADFRPDSPQWKSTMQSFQLMKQVHSRNPQLFKKYLTDSKQRIQFNDWRVLSEYGSDGEVSALIDIGSQSALNKVVASVADQQQFSDDIVKGLDGWGWGDLAADDEDVKTLFKEKMVQYARTISKYSEMNPAQIVDAYMQEVVDDHSVVNGKLVFMGGATNIDNEQFQKDAQLYLEDATNTLLSGAYKGTSEKLTLRYTGRGNTFWIVDQAGRTLPTAPISINSFYNYSLDKTRDTKQDAANALLNKKQNPNKKAAR